MAASNDGDRMSLIGGGYESIASNKDSNADGSKANDESQASNADRFGFIRDSSRFTESKPFLSNEVLRNREIKWLDMLTHWEKYMLHRYAKVRERCRKGIPPSIRGKAWSELCGARVLLERNPHVFDALLLQPGSEENIDDIKKDLHRQFPHHEMFADKGGHGQEDLFRVLKAYSILNPAVGYCQAQAPIASILLMHLPAEQAFWCLVSVCDRYLPGYFSAGMEAVQVDGEILFGLLRKESYMVYKHIKKQKIEPVLYMTEWFLCIFSRTLPWSSVLRVWDMLFSEGVKILFRVALVLLKCTLARPNLSRHCPTMYETLECLRSLPPQVTEEQFLVDQMQRLTITEADMEKEHQRALVRRSKVKTDGRRESR